MCLIGETSYQFWLIGLTHFWLNAGSTLINHSKNTGSWLRSKVMTSSAGRSLLSSDWLMMCHAAAPVSTMKSTYYLLRSLIIFISDTLSMRCHHYPTTPRKSQFALPRVRVFVNVLMRKRVSVWRSLASEKVSKLFLWCMSSGSLRQTAWYYIIKASSWPQPLENGIYVKSYVCFKHISNDLFSISSSEPSASFICVKYQRHDPLICKIGFIFSWSQWK